MDAVPAETPESTFRLLAQLGGKVLTLAGLILMIPLMFGAVALFAYVVTLPDRPDGILLLAAGALLSAFSARFSTVGAGPGEVRLRLVVDVLVVPTAVLVAATVYGPAASSEGLWLNLVAVLAVVLAIWRAVQAIESIVRFVEHHGDDCPAQDDAVGDLAERA